MSQLPAVVEDAAGRELGALAGREHALVAPSLASGMSPVRIRSRPHNDEASPSAPIFIRISEAMLKLERLIERVARGTILVLVLGETGTGKEVIARELHERSPRRDGPWQVVNCAALPDTLLESLLFGHQRGSFTGAERDRPGAFELARDGTLFLDEIGELSPSAQAALLRVLDGGRVRPLGGQKEIAVNARVVAATHRDLAAMAQAGTFRLDLYHRLNVLPLHLPPLRERREEIAPLSEHFLARSAAAAGSGATRIDSAAMERLLQYDWPGNVRELRNVIERAVAIADGETIGLEELPIHVQSVSAPTGISATQDSLELQGGLRMLLRDHEAKLIQLALERTGGNQRQAAALLELPLRTLERKLASLGPRRSSS